MGLANFGLVAGMLMVSGLTAEVSEPIVVARKTNEVLEERAVVATEWDEALPVEMSSPTEDSVPSRCIIIIDEMKYDVTEFRSSHSGGDVFVCETDMTAIFYGRHPKDYLNKMTKYRI